MHNRKYRGRSPRPNPGLLEPTNDYRNGAKPAEVTQRYSAISAEVLQRSCRGLAEVPERYRRGTGEVPERFPEVLPCTEYTVIQLPSMVCGPSLHFCVASIFTLHVYRKVQARLANFRERLVLYDIQDIFLERPSVLHFVEKTVPCQLSDSGHDLGQYGHPGLFFGAAGSWHTGC